VAVKVQYPGIAEAVETDLRNVNILLPLVKRLRPGLDVEAIAGELRDRIGEELDYEIEAQNQRRSAGRSAATRSSRSRAWTRPCPRAACSSRTSSTRWRSSRSSAARGRARPLRRDPVPLLLRPGHPRAHRGGRPAPGNTLLADDGRVIFLDFGFIRRMDPAYLEEERALARAVIAGDADAVKASLAELGYLPEPTASSPRTCSDSCGWRRVVLRAGLPAAGPRVRARDDRGGHLAAVALLRADAPADGPAEAVLIRRMEGLLFSVLGELRAGADWGALALEYIAGRPPTTELGRIEEQWLLAAAA
jgi:hypothetical protein